MAKAPHGIHPGSPDEGAGAAGQSGGAGRQERKNARTRRGGRDGRDARDAREVREADTSRETRESGRDAVRESRRRRRRRSTRGAEQSTARPAARNRGGKKSYATSKPASRYAANKMETRDETSAGGLVVSGLAEAVDERGNVDLSRVYVALIGRLDRRGRLLWSMPKGHVEPGEDIAATAEREVWEETGIHGEVFAQLGVIDYWFVSEGTRIHKTVHHHLLRYVDGDLNDEDPEVTEVAWIPASALIEHFAYADERKLARIAHDLLPQLAVKEHEAGRMTPR